MFTLINWNNYKQHFIGLKFIDTRNLVVIVVVVGDSGGDGSSVSMRVWPSVVDQTIRTRLEFTCSIFWSSVLVEICASLNSTHSRCAGLPICCCQCIQDTFLVLSN